MNGVSGVLGYSRRRHVQKRLADPETEGLGRFGSPVVEAFAGFRAEFAPGNHVAENFRDCRAAVNVGEQFAFDGGDEVPADLLPHLEWAGNRQPPAEPVLDHCVHVLSRRDPLLHQGEGFPEQRRLQAIAYESQYFPVDQSRSLANPREQIPGGFDCLVRCLRSPDQFHYRQQVRRVEVVRYGHPVGPAGAGGEGARQIGRRVTQQDGPLRGRLVEPPENALLELQVLEDRLDHDVCVCGGVLDHRHGGDS